MYSRSERGLSEVLGAILVFALVVSGLALFQVNAVPAANEGVEFDHSRAVQQDLLDVDARVSSTAALGSSQSAVVETGVTYPNRFLFVNPGPASGSLAAEPAPFTIRHANATGETGDYWNGTDRSFESQRIVYRPAYNHYDGPVTALEAGVVYNTFDNGEVLQVDRGAFISGNRISLVAVTGDLSGTSGDSVAIELVPLSVPTRSISVTNATDESVVIRLTTDLDASTWATFLADEMASGHVVNVSTGPGGTVDIVLEQGVTYELRLAKVAVGSGDGTEPVAYVTHRDGLDTSIPGSGGTVAVVAHDRFNNPVSGVDMTFTSSQGTFGGVGSTTATTDASGVASATFTPDANLTRSNVSAGIDRNGDGSLSDESSEAYVSYELTVLTSSTDYRASEINPDETTGSIVWTDANVVKKNKSPGQIDVKF